MYFGKEVKTRLFSFRLRISHLGIVMTLHCEFAEGAPTSVPASHASYDISLTLAHPESPHFNPVGVPMLFISPILGAPELTVPSKPNLCLHLSYLSHATNMA
jgi:hypothetical protein